ncbi:MAG: hypothetical protein Q8N39_08015 [Pelolinea sp.]|nr:hypothetical protein [Pelolinea sp.]
MKQSFSSNYKKNIFFSVLIGIVILIIGFVIASAQEIPYRIVTKYPASMILDEAKEMHKCGECHESKDFHTCETCHNEHGSAVLSGLSFNSTIYLTGDVPEEKFIPSNHIFLNENQKLEKITINELLKKYGIDKFKSITLYSNDGGFTTIESDQLGDTSFLLPYEESIRFADENLHVSTWLKGISKIIVVGDEKNLSIGGRKTTFGELLIKDTVQFTVEQAPVMLKNNSDGLIRTGYTAERMEGIEVAKLLTIEDEKDYSLKLVNGTIQDLKGSELTNSKLVLIGSDVVLVFPEKSRNTWIKQIVSIDEKL